MNRSVFNPIASYLFWSFSESITVTMSYGYYRFFLVDFVTGLIPWMDYNIKEVF